MMGGDRWVISSKEDVESFLQDVRSALNSKKCTCKDRKKNLDTLATLGWVWNDALVEVYTLTYYDYLYGPEPDRDYPLDDDFWMFKRNIQGYPIYIKLKVQYLQDSAVLLWSFHIDDGYTQ